MHNSQHDSVKYFKKETEKEIMISFTLIQGLLSDSSQGSIYLHPSRLYSEDFVNELVLVVHDKVFQRFQHLNLCKRKHSYKKSMNLCTIKGRMRILMLKCHIRILCFLLSYFLWQFFFCGGWWGQNVTSCL